MHSFVCRASGHELKIKCQMIRGCPTGAAWITKAYDLACTYVMHADEPRYLDGARGEPETFISCCQSIFYLVKNTVWIALRSPQLAQGFINILPKNLSRLPLQRHLPYKKYRKLWFCSFVTLKKRYKI